MTPAQFMEMKVGQRLLILQKCQDIAIAEDLRLAPARNEFLSVMLRLGIYLEPEEYQRVVVPSVRLGLGCVDLGGKVNRGVISIRDALIDAAADVSTTNHRVMVAAIRTWLSGVKLEEQKSGLYHTMRLLVQALMANPDCHDDDARELAVTLNRINELQRSRAHDSEADSSEPIEPIFTDG
jgi:hypothetical protein